MRMSFTQVADTLQFLRGDCNLVHRAISPESIIVVGGAWKLASMGWSMLAVRTAAAVCAAMCSCQERCEYRPTESYNLMTRGTYAGVQRRQHYQRSCVQLRSER